MTETPNIKLLKTEPTVRREATIELLEKTLAEAKDGQIASLALAIVRPDGSTCTRRGNTHNIAAITGAIAFLLDHVVREANGDGA